MNKHILLLLLLTLFMACQPENSAKSISGNALGTTYNIKYFSDEELKVETALDSIFEIINTSMSTYQQDSHISRINRGDTSIVVDEHFVKVFRASEKIYKESEGFFDPTVGNLVNAYGFGPKKGLKQPDEACLDSLHRLVGFDKLELDPDNRIRKAEPGIYIDFNAIAKGYAIDVIAEYFDEKNVSDYLIELGGELVAKGRNKQKDSDWIVAIDDPKQVEGERTFQTILALKDRAMATSGNYRKFKTDSSGNTFVHTINPLTGLAEKNDLLSASVLAENCTLADAYASAFMAMGFEKASALLGKLDNVDAYFIYVKKGEPVVYASEGFKKTLRD
ncbi:FAD:protein FMN transferase [Salegentibacter sediminis]|uniref:FAD:protein FMN transferase n=1 Tax=Salegentibacter sediminis TaxID=1930251 RepID=UPI001E58681D|nr:FAD:protein FMN transferase [Salegentibacter sediminis]